IRVLVIDDEKAICISCKKILEEAGHTVDMIQSGTEGAEKAINGDYDLVLLDLKLKDASGLDVLERIRSRRTDVSIIIITGYATIQTSIEAIKKGAFDYVPKPFSPDELLISVNKAIEDRNLRKENERLRTEIERMKKSNRIIYRSKVMEDVMNQILKIAPTDFTVTIYGESGTGKELIAQAIHQNSSRCNKPFVGVDLSSLAPSLIESELFGHVKGAFTGATYDRPGYFAMADGGTLFLDEISNTSLELQGKLLRALETRRIRPVGSEKEVEVNVRIITATNKDLSQMMEKGQFREDLFYRLNVIPINLPPLREWSEDIPILAMYFLSISQEELKTKVRAFSNEAMAKLLSYKFPGNIRELRNIVERIAATTDSEIVRLSDLPEEIRDIRQEGPVIASAVPKTAEELQEVKRRLREAVYSQVEKDFVLDALNRSGWNVTRAAELVGMLRPNFHALMRKYGIRTRDEGDN
ncbi:MAG: sigma-54 dependent transcriptional regulator, partial [Deltaproteobacteria bacterium]|nr:sigma-54 dependent transcriptional regulator [Deltaproteobacteria bacterium]